jgi:hypothetical protein
MTKTRIGDAIAVVYVLVLVIYLIFSIDSFVALTKGHPIIMGFFKVALLATFGEFLKVRRKTGNWVITHPIQRFFVWGIFGIWFTYAFPLFDAGVVDMMNKHLWPSVWGNLFEAFSKSFWINFAGGYAYTMMITHEYFNKVIDKQGFVSLTQFAEEMDKKVWFRFIPLTVFFFWIPAHTVTFMLPGYYRVLMAAVLSVALGFILTIKKK